MDEFNNPYIIVPFVAWLTAQILKFGIKSWQTGKVNQKYLISSGNMPSSHTSTVVALLTTTLIMAGVSTPAFGIVAVITMIVIYDALNVRRAVGDHRAALKVLFENDPKLAAKTDIDEILNLNEALGHKPSEVGAGALLGIATAATLLWGDWETSRGELGLAPGEGEQRVYLIIGVVLLISGLIWKYYLLSKYKRDMILKKLTSINFASFTIPGAVLILLSLAQSEGIAYFGTRVFAFAAIGATLVMFVFMTKFFVQNNKKLVQKSHVPKKKKQQRNK